MPVRRYRRGLGRRRMRGRGVMELLRRGSDFLKNTQLLSKGAAALAPSIGGKFGGYLSQAGNLAGSLGYGRRRRRMGRGLRLAGM